VGALILGKCTGNIDNDGGSANKAVTSSSPHATEEVLVLQQHLGLSGDLHGCDCWRTQQKAVPVGLQASQAEPAHSKVASALRNVIICISAARATALVLRADWCFAALQALSTHTKIVTAAAKNNLSRQACTNPVPAWAHSLKRVAKALEEPLRECMEIIDEVPKRQRHKMDHASVVYLLANLDSMYYVLLDHSLTAGTMHGRLRRVGVSSA
jgi:hypothetical protein